MENNITKTNSAQWGLANQIVINVFMPLQIKLMRLGPSNRIVDDSDSKPADFHRQFRSDSKSNN